MKRYYQEVCERLEAEDEEAKQQDDEDIEVQIGDGGAATNATCPLTGKQVRSSSPLALFSPSAMLAC